MNTPYQEDAHQVHLGLTGDVQAFEPLVRRYQSASLDSVSDDLDAQDLVQDAFVTADTKLGQPRQSETFDRWLRKIVVNRFKGG
jgi:DNA-directed RNA polymerase specialized sigma24 family protein